MRISINRPKVTSSEDISALKKEMKKFYNEHLNGKKIVNEQKGISVILSSSGRQHALFARKTAFEKLIAITKLDEMIEKALFINFKNPDADDSKNIIGYMNFKIKILINNNLCTFRIVVRITKDGKFYYDHAIRMKKD